ncbi:MAG TPA: phosphate ABC transporter permease PstA [Candidatus Polarisedimenticolia bacterium]|nr:phosphate ABC transporter permease PstA [Candidatus Polarisedimenticolia bacterium]
MTTEPVMAAPCAAAPRGPAAGGAAAGPSPGRGAARGPSRTRSRRTSAPAAGGEPFVWLTGAGLAAAGLMILALLTLILAQGAATFWPRPLVELRLRDGRTLLGEITRTERYRPGEEELAALPPERQTAIVRSGGFSTRRLLRVGNYDLYGEDFVWVPAHQVAAEQRPAGAWLIERREWGPAVGYVRRLLADGRPVAEGDDVAAQLGPRLQAAHSLIRRIRALEKGPIGSIHHGLEQARLQVRRAALRHGEGSEEHRRAAGEAARREEELNDEYRVMQARVESLRRESDRIRLEVAETRGGIIPERPSDPESFLLLSQVVRAYPANVLGFGDKLAIYASRWWEYLTDEPREANTEGGIFPALFGTLMMTVLMSLMVAPFGVVAALYLREYARQGPLVSAVRIAVNNLAGVPSIVFGVFGLGFFCYVLGGSIDQILFPEKLPAPTYGTGGILWASLTLALLTVPVVIVATEEALAAVPRSMREGSFACGASRWQTIARIVLPRATPGIMTGLILAMARGAGEVAPLMITGVVKLAPALPFDGRFPFIHPERSFMHLGFHIYDVGFQSRNAEAGKPMVFTTTLLLIVLIALLNLAAVWLRSRLRRRFSSAHF